MRLDTRAFAQAASLTLGSAVLVVTLLLVLLGAHGGRVGMTALWPGYSLSVLGSAIGSLWAALYGYVFGAVFAVIYNVVNVPPAPPPFDWTSETQEKDT